MIEDNILAEISDAIELHDDWRALGIFTESQNCGIHIAVMVQPFLNYILQGRKTIESRFSKPLIAPYKRVSVGDLVLLKAGPVVASFRASSVEFIELNESERQRLMTECSAAICADDEFWKARADKNYATLVGIHDVRQLTPLRISKSDRRGWLVLRDSSSESAAGQLSLM